MRRTFLGSVIAFVLASNLANTMAAALPQSPIPLQKGWAWVYEGKVEWTVAGSTNVKSATIRWKMEVIDSLAGPVTQATVVRGFPSELAWYEPGQTAGFTVLCAVSNRVYRFAARDASEAGQLARRCVKNGPSLPPSGEEWLALPLRKGNRWGGEKDRDDLFYCWYVEEEKTTTLRIEGLHAQKPFTIYTLAYRSMPDHQFFDIAPGLGITRYVFGHHGTVASATVQVVSVSRPEGSVRR